jgi:hypothetical protein
MASDASTTTLTMGTYTASPTSYTNTIGGTYYAEPNFDFTITRCIPYWSAGYIDINNAVRNERMRMTRAWLPGDRVVISGKTKTAQIYASVPTVIDTLDSIAFWSSSNTLTLNTANEIEGTGCANVVMAAGATSTSLARLNYTATDLSTSSGTVLIPIFIPTPTSGTVATVRLTIGSDSTLATNSLYWNVTSQWDGSAIATNAWNYFSFPLNTAATSTTGTPVRTAIKSIEVSLRNTTNFQLNGWRVDYISRYVVSSTPTTLDYEGSPIGLDIGSSTAIISDEFTSRNITITGDYYKRYI